MRELIVLSWNFCQSGTKLEFFLSFLLFLVARVGQRLISQNLCVTIIGIFRQFTEMFLTFKIVFIIIHF